MNKINTKPESSLLQINVLKWKRVSFLITLFFIFTIVIQSCQVNELKDNTNGANIDYQKIEAQYAEGLDYVLNFLKKQGEKSKINLDSLQGLMQKASVEYMNENMLLKDEAQRNKINQLLNKSGSALNIETKEDGVHYHLSQEIVNIYTPIQKSLLQEIFIVSKDMTLGLDATLGKYNEIEARAKAVCTNQELPLILSTLAIGKASMKYWSQNYKKWNDEIYPLIKDKNVALALRIDRGEPDGGDKSGTANGGAGSGNSWGGIWNPANWGDNNPFGWKSIAASGIVFGAGTYSGLNMIAGATGLVASASFLATWTGVGTIVAVAFFYGGGVYIEYISRKQR